MFQCKCVFRDDRPAPRRYPDHSGTRNDHVGDKGVDLAGALSVSPGVWMYQLTDKGLAAELAVKGTKYSKDSDLN